MDSFDDIRPFYDSEIPEAMARVAEWPDLPQAIRFIYPDADIEETRRKIGSVQTIKQLQSTVMNDAIKRIVHATTEGLTCSGISRLRRGTPYLFVSNHRDITLDAFLLQHLLIERGFDTSYIVFGQNLLSAPVMYDLFRANKLVRMPRGGSPRAFYDSLHHLSDYINHLVREGRHSVWIAQKNGRSKDGVDTTAEAMLKMLCLGGGGDSLSTLVSLNLVPVSVSYEWDPCDAMKALELHRRSLGAYEKAPDEDFRSVVAGIIGEKGHVHLHIGVPLQPDEMAPGEGMDVCRHVAGLLDSRIQAGYHLMPSNYVAYSLLHGRQLPGRYTERTEAKLLQRVDDQPDPKVRRLMLEAYAAPVESKERLSAL